jgi:hypothetical protein
LSAQQNHKQFSSSDIKRYLKGEMTAAEMHDLEKAALGDPFLEDAIEGFASEYGTDNQALDRDLNLLRERIQAKGNAPQVVVMKRNYWLRIAAMIILLAGTATLLFTLLSNPGENQSLAVKDTRRNIPNQQPEAAAATIDSALVASPPVAMRKAMDSHALINKQPKDATAIGSQRQESDQGVSNANALMKEQDVASTANRSLIEAAAAEQPVQEFRGKIMDAGNKPIEGAAVSLNNNQAKVVSDKEGNFIVRSFDTAVQAEVIAEGYQKESIMLKRNAPPAPIVLQENLAGKSEGIATTSRKAKMTVASLLVEPANGWQSFETYLARNKKEPEARKFIAGEVMLSFTVNRRGRPEHIKVEKSLSSTADKEAVRLLKEGPDWKIITPGVGKATIVMKF